MKRKTVFRGLALVLVIAWLCPLSVAALKETCVVTWTVPKGSYVAAVTGDSLITGRSIPIRDTMVTVLPNETQEFGGCTYQVSFSNELWGSHVMRLDEAGAKVGVYSSYSADIYFPNTYCLTGANNTGTYCAMTTGYGHNGSYYVEKLGMEPEIMTKGSFTFAPCGCGNVIESVVDINFIS